MRYASTGLLIAFGSLVFGCGSNDRRGSSENGGGGDKHNESTDAGGGAAESDASGQGEGGRDELAWEGCTSVREAALGLVDSVSDAEVTVIEQGDDRALLYVDASAGGFQGAAQNAYVYVNLERAERVKLSDAEADVSSAWDIAIKRTLIRTNGGDSGIAQAASAKLESAFDEVGQQSVDTANFERDEFIDAECELNTDPGIGGIVTPMSSWYEYDESTMVLTPLPVTYIVRGADGESLYKLQIETYYATPDGETEGLTSGRYLIRYAPL